AAERLGPLTRIAGLLGPAPERSGGDGVSTEQLPIADRAETLRWLRRELRARWGEAAGAFAVGLLAAAAAVTPVYALGVLVDRVRAGAPSSDIVWITVVIAAAALVAGVTTAVSTYLIARLGGRIL